MKIKRKNSNYFVRALKTKKQLKHKELTVADKRKAVVFRQITSVRVLLLVIGYPYLLYTCLPFLVYCLYVLGNESSLRNSHCVR